MHFAESLATLERLWSWQDGHGLKAWTHFHYQLSDVGVQLYFSLELNS